MMLSDDQARFAARVAELATLDPAIAAAWVGAAPPGPHFTYLEPDHPGFPSVEHAAQSAAARIRTSSLRTRLNAGPLALIKAIGDDPQWPGTSDAIVNNWASA